MSQENGYTHPAHNDNYTSLIEVSDNPHANAVAEFLERVIAEKRKETTEELVAIAGSK